MDYSKSHHDEKTKDSSQEAKCSGLFTRKSRAVRVLVKWSTISQAGLIGGRNGEETKKKNDTVPKLSQLFTVPAPVDANDNVNVEEHIVADSEAEELALCCGENQELQSTIAKCRHPSRVGGGATNDWWRWRCAGD